MYNKQKSCHGVCLKCFILCLCDFFSVITYRNSVLRFLLGFSCLFWRILLYSAIMSETAMLTYFIYVFCEKFTKMPNKFALIRKF